MFDGKVPHWHHFSCFWQRAAAQSTADIDGFSSLRWEDQEKVKKAIESGGATGGRSCKYMRVAHCFFLKLVLCVFVSGAVFMAVFLQEELTRRVELKQRKR